MVREVKRTDLGTKGQRRCLKACWLVDQCCRLLQFFPPILCWRSSSEFHLCNLRASFSLLVFCTFFFPCSADFICKKMKAKTERQSLLVYGFSFFLCFLPFFFSSSVPSSVFSFSPSLVTEMDEDNSTAASAHSRWSLLLGTLKTMATPVLCSFSFLLALCGDDEGDGDENVLCWLSSHPCLCVFSAFDSGVLLSSFFLSFLSFFLFLCSFFLRFSTSL